MTHDPGRQPGARPEQHPPAPADRSALRSATRIPAARPQRTARRPGRPPSAGPHQSTPRAQPLRGDRNRQTGHVAQGPERGEPEQRRTDGYGHRPPRHGLVFGEPVKQTEQQWNQQRARDDTGQRQCLRLRTPDRQRSHHGGRGFADRDEDRRTRRMWLVSGDVEVADPEREVHRVDVLRAEGR